MHNADSKISSQILTSNDLTMVRGISRRMFVKYSAGTLACIYFGAFETACGGNGGGGSYPIDSNVLTTAQRAIVFPTPVQPSGPGSGTGLYKTELPNVSQFDQYGYGSYTFGGPLPVQQRFDLMPAGYNPTHLRLKQLANFFTISDIHITDKEAPNQLIYMQQADAAHGAAVTSIYSPVMLYTTHVLDAAIQTINALHKQQAPFDFGISLGDTCNSTQYNELRWYIDVIDGKAIAPSSGAHLGAFSVDYQKPYQAAGLNKDIPWYQVLGNHDHFCLGSIPVDADPTLGIRQSYIAGNVWAVGDVLAPNAGFPNLFDTTASLKQKSFYMGVLDGSTPTGSIKGAGAAASMNPPTVAADPNRRSLYRTEWINEFFKTTSTPVGHGLNLVDPSMGSGFACYSFVPKSTIPLKVIVLDDTQSETDGSHDIHGHGFLDATRWNWLQAELAAGQDSNQLMIIAAHIPIAVGQIGISEVEWWESEKDKNATEQNAVSLTNLVAVLQNTPNLLLWIAGHRHVNTVKAFLTPGVGGGPPENGFWQVETSSLRDFPQQLRTFAIYLNSDYTISIVTTNVDPAVADGSPAATSRKYAIAAQQIIQNDLAINTNNYLVQPGVGISVESMDPTRPQDGTQDPTIIYGTVPGYVSAASGDPVPYPSYNAELFKPLSPTMIEVLQAQFPTSV
jgi:metallophosphoesterase (TIGR03768 family)